MEVYNSETIGKLIKKYCEMQKLEEKNLYLTKKNLKKLKNELTLNRAKIKNDETIFLCENDDSDEEINFNINYQNKKFPVSGWKNDIFLDCIKFFTEEKTGKNFLFIYNDNILDKNKTLLELKIKNGDEVKVGEFK